MKKWREGRNQREREGHAKQSECDFEIGGRRAGAEVLYTKEEKNRIRRRGASEGEREKMTTMNCSGANGEEKR